MFAAIKKYIPNLVSLLCFSLHAYYYYAVVLASRLIRVPLLDPFSLLGRKAGLGEAAEEDKEDESEADWH